MSVTLCPGTLAEVLRGKPMFDLFPCASPKT
jgi:hypothetical protein